MVLAAVAAYTAAAPAQQILAGGMQRTFRVYRPANLPADNAVPLVVVLHGGFGNGAQAERAYDWDREADRRGFIVAYPDGYRHSWNAGTCCGPAMTQNVDDVAFLSAMIRRIESQNRIDAARVAIAGMSNGAIMAQRMACEATIALRAIGSVSGTLSVPCTHPQRLSVIEIHGMADRNIPFYGGTGIGAGRVQTPPILGVFATWRRLEQCGAPVVASRQAITMYRSSCNGGGTVELIAIAGAGHQWPGSQPPSRAAIALARALGLHGLDPPSDALDATDTLYRFFFER